MGILHNIFHGLRVRTHTNTDDDDAAVSAESTDIDKPPEKTAYMKYREEMRSREQERIRNQEHTEVSSGSGNFILKGFTDEEVARELIEIAIRCMAEKQYDCANFFVTGHDACTALISLDKEKKENDRFRVIVNLTRNGESQVMHYLFVPGCQTREELYERMQTKEVRDDIYDSVIELCKHAEKYL